MDENGKMENEMKQWGYNGTIISQEACRVICKLALNPSKQLHCIKHPSNLPVNSQFANLNMGHISSLFFPIEMVDFPYQDGPPQIWSLVYKP